MSIERAARPSAVAVLPTDAVSAAPRHVPAHDHAADQDVGVTARPRLLVRLVEWYQRAFEGRPSPCRFTPSCSSYAHEALVVHGTWRGLYLTVRRLARCRPFGPSGFDPVPQATASAAVPKD